MNNIQEFQDQQTACKVEDVPRYSQMRKNPYHKQKKDAYNLVGFKPIGHFDKK